MTSDWPAIKELVTSVKDRKVSALELVERSLNNIESSKEYKAIISLTKERAIKRAKEIDKRIEDGEDVGALAGIPFIAKDNFLVFGNETTAASNILKGFNAPYQSTAIERLENAGAICVAKANLDAFAHGSSTENSDFFTTLNPSDKTRVPGGSSGGSAAAVMLNMAPFALGTDTGGSIRLPATFCGAVGYKPTYGLVSRSGVVAMASSTDTIGPITKNVEDSSIVLDVMSGKDDLDSTTIDIDNLGYSNIASVDLKGIKFGIISEFMTEGVDDSVKQSINRTIDLIKSAGGEIVPISLPSQSLALAVYYILVPAEISSNLSRYDGQRYGFSDSDAKDLDSSYVNSRSKGFGKEAKRRIIIGTHVLSSGYYDAYYKKAQLVRTKIINEFNDAFSKVDFLIGPTAPYPAFKIGENINDPLKMYLADIMTVGASLAGLPAIVIPTFKADNLPNGLQIMAPQKQDRKLLEIAKSIEKEIKK